MTAAAGVSSCLSSSEHRLIDSLYNTNHDKLDSIGGICDLFRLVGIYMRPDTTEDLLLTVGFDRRRQGTLSKPQFVAALETLVRDSEEEATEERALGDAFRYLCEEAPPGKAGSVTMRPSSSEIPKAATTIAVDGSIPAASLQDLLASRGIDARALHIPAGAETGPLSFAEFVGVVSPRSDDAASDTGHESQQEYSSLKAQMRSLGFETPAAEATPQEQYFKPLYVDNSDVSSPSGEVSAETSGQMDFLHMGASGDGLTPTSSGVPVPEAESLIQSLEGSPRDQVAEGAELVNGESRTATPRTATSVESSEPYQYRYIVLIDARPWRDPPPGGHEPTPSPLRKRLNGKKYRFTRLSLERMKKIILKDHWYDLALGSMSPAEKSEVRAFVNPYPVPVHQSPGVSKKKLIQEKMTSQMKRWTRTELK